MSTYVVRTGVFYVTKLFVEPGPPLARLTVGVGHRRLDFLIPADMADNWPCEGDNVPPEWAAHVERYGASMGMYPLGPECAKHKALRGYVVGGGK